ncbi:MAG: creatininase family protein [Chloroflexi bacterium]|nr:creatininase family protein [Chloroflexota bacterium]
MLISEMNWMQVEQFLLDDDRCILPTGSTEQHAYLSLSVDTILASRLAREVGTLAKVPVYPVVPYGLAQQWTAFPGTVTLRIQTYLALIRDVLDSIRRAGFRRILLINGHGGNAPAQGMLREWMMDNPECTVKWHNWYNAPLTWQKVVEIDPIASHASWMENTPWTRLDGVEMPSEQKPLTDLNKLSILSPGQTREQLGDGNMGGLYQRSDEDMLAIWQVAVEETLALLEGGWN